MIWAAEIVGHFCLSKCHQRLPLFIHSAVAQPATRRRLAQTPLVLVACSQARGYPFRDAKSLGEMASSTIAYVYYVYLACVYDSRLASSKTRGKDLKFDLRHHIPFARWYGDRIGIQGPILIDIAGPCPF